MNNQLSSKDWQLLSAYLDGQLSTRERAQVEQRLRIQPDYRDALQTLRQNQVMLRSLPRRRVPRNFTLTPEMVTSPRRTIIPPLAPFLRFSSALATAFLILTLALQQLPRLSPAMQATAPDSAPEEVTTLMEEAAPAAEPEMSAMEAPAGEAEPPVVYWGGPPSIPYANGLGGGADVYGRGGGGGGSDGGTGELPNVFSPPVQIYPGEPKIGAGGEEGEPPAPAPAEEDPTAIAQVPELKGTGPILGVPADEDAGTLLETLPQPEAGPAEDLFADEAAPANNLLAVQIGLGALALITGLAAFFLRRKAAR